MRLTAVIPARGGSKRIPRKNIRPFCGLPLLLYATRAARAVGRFQRIVVSSDDLDVLAVARQDDPAVVCRWVGAPCHQDDSTDVQWLEDLRREQLLDEAFAILRPTSPFRTAETIQRGIAQFACAEVHSIRAVQPVTEHPGKMWEWAGSGSPMTPLLSRTRSDGTPWHSSPTQSLPVIYHQNACLEIAWTYVLRSFGTISGHKVAPFFTTGYEGVDLNTEDDWRAAERLVAAGAVVVPGLSVAPPAAAHSA